MSVFIIKRIKNLNQISQLQIFNKDYIQQGFIKKNNSEIIINIFDKIFKFPISCKNKVYHISDNLVKTRFESWFWKDINYYYGSVITINFENNYELILNDSVDEQKKFVFMKKKTKVIDKFELNKTFMDSIIVKSNKNINLINLDTEELYLLIRKIHNSEFQIAFSNKLHKLDALIIIAPLLFN
tara:strand:- start:240 stop:791 length:552 start_codon:yes stop_codon:yes gene_type:complete